MNRPNETMVKKVAIDGLGKPTKRGVKACFNCSFVNGVRSYFCKGCSIELKPKLTKVKKKIICPKIPIIINIETAVNVEMENVKNSDENWTVLSPIIDEVVTKAKTKTEKKIKDPLHLSPCLKFENWLENFTERINQHFQVKLNGNLVTVTEFIPTNFFNLLIERLSSTVKSANKLCLPNSTTTIARTETPPLGTFVMYTWNIENFQHLKTIFDSPEVFLINQKRLKLSSDSNNGDCSQYKQILPTEISVKLNLAKEDESYFTLCWTPNINQRKTCGELKVQFSYNHFINNKPSTFEDAKKMLDSYL